MRIVSLSLALLFLVFGARLADAVTLNPGDILMANNGSGSLMRVDPTSGDQTVVSGCFVAQCGIPAVGSGPAWGGSLSSIALELDGSILVAGRQADPPDEPSIFRVDPTTGDRVVVASTSIGAGVGGAPWEIPAALAVVPGPEPSMVSVLPGWAVALILGIAIGALLQLRRVAAVT